LQLSGDAYPVIFLRTEDLLLLGPLREGREGLEKAVGAFIKVPGISLESPKR